MSKFLWIRQPSGTTIYVDHRGDDLTGDGSPQNPYQTLLKATTVGTAGSNIMLGDGVWSGERYSTRAFVFYGNTRTILGVEIGNSINFWDIYRGDEFNNLILNRCRKGSAGYYAFTFNAKETIIVSFVDRGSNSTAGYSIIANNCIFINTTLIQTTYGTSSLINCIFAKCTLNNESGRRECVSYINCLFVLTNQPTLVGNNSSNNNWTDKNIPTNSNNSINNTSTGQTIADYFTYVHPNVLANPATASIYDWLACDFTAKPGSANIGAGTNDGNIGFNQGYPARATNDSNDIFAAANGATLRNIAWNATQNGYSLVHKDKVCAGYTVNTITLAADAEAIDDYYNGLFIGITAGDGAGEIHRIVDYDGATKVATIDTSWQSAISTSSVYSISGTIDSATKDFGRVIKVKRNWAFLANMQSWTDPNVSSYGMWKEFLTSPLQNNGEWMMRPCSNFRYEYSINGTEWHSSTELLAGTDSDNRTYNAAYGNASESYVAANAKTTLLRYVRYHIEIGFNIGEDAQ